METEISIGAELEQYLQDPTFVDYFNVFLSLPVFSQRLLFKTSVKEFEFDPPLRKSKYILDKNKLIKWLTSERLPLFLSSDLYHEYVLCKELLNTRLYYSESGHCIDYEIHRHEEDILFKNHAIGHVVGMRQFNYYIKGTPGERLLNFWMDAERFKMTPTTELWVKWRMYRDIQTKYFKGKNIGTFDLLQDGTDVMNSNTWCGKNMNNQNDVSHCYADLQKEEIMKIINSTEYSQIQNLIILVLKNYWLQRYFLHIRLLKEKKKEKAQSFKSTCKVLSKSDIAILKDIKEIDKALRLLQADKEPNPQVTNAKSNVNWRTMFPENTVDGSFLNEEGEIVTMHKSGNVTVDPIDSTLDAILEQYINSSSSDNSCDEFIHKQITMKQAIEEAVADNRRASVGQPTRKDIETAKNNNTAKEKRSLSKLASRTSTAASASSSCSFSVYSSFSVQDVSAASSRMSQTTGAESVELMGSILKTQASKNDPNCTKKNMHLFDQLLHLHFHTGCDDDENIRRRPKSTPVEVAKVSCNSVRLPHIKVNAKTIKMSNHAILPPIEEQQKIFPEASHVIPEAGNSVVDVEELVFTFKNMCEGYFRYDYRDLTVSMAVDCVAGYPFDSFLKKQRSYKRITYLQFWHDIQLYLTTNKLDKAIKDRRSKLLTVRYILNKNAAFLPPELLSPLIRLLPLGKADDLLREAQDFVCSDLQGLFALYCRKDKKKFRDTCIIRKSFHRRRFSSVQSSSPVFEDNSGLPPVIYGTQLEDEENEDENNDNIFPKTEYNMKENERERRMFKAAQFALDAASQFDEGLPLNELLVEELEWDPNDQHGSLNVTKLILVHRRDLVEYKERLKFIAKQKKAKLELEKLRLREKKKTDVHTDDIPFYMKAFKKAGIWFQRPLRPRMFQDVMKDPIHREFFRRFLIFHTAETPMNFCNAVEDLKSCKDPRAKQTRMTQITRKYFVNVQSAIEILNTNADIVQAIPSQEKVTMAMLISAQSWVARALHDNWFEKYQVTYPDIVQENLNTGTIRQTTDNGQRQWGKDRTKRLWLNFAMTIMMFRKCILNPANANAFEIYLKNEIKKEIEKQKTTVQGYVHGMPIRKVIRNKLIDVTKLVNDMHFVAEADRYRTMCDDARDNANSGTYCPELEKLIESKAKMLVDCFIDSDIPPRTQVNLTQEQVESILSIFRSGLSDRGLFHSAIINILPVVAFIWKKFQKHMITEMYEKWLEKSMAKKVEEVPVFVKKAPVYPDYTYATLNQIVTKRVVAHKGEEDIAKLFFSLSHGIRMVLPLNITPTNYGFSNSKEGASMLMSSSILTSTHGPSFLRQRRHAVAESKVSIQNSQQQMIRSGSQAGGRMSGLGHRGSLGGSRMLQPLQSTLMHSQLQQMLPEQISSEQVP